MPRKPHRKPKTSLRPAEVRTTDTLRIIGGRFGGRKLEYSGDIRTRPMKQRVREAIFNLVGPAAQGTHAVDLFAGTGALGLEALSRGAVGATFIEQHRPTAAIIRQNLASLGVEDVCQLVTSDTFFWGRQEQIAAKEPWLVFLSPPYSFYLERTEEILELLAGIIRRAPPSSLLVVEADDTFAMEQLPQEVPAEAVAPAGSLDWDIRNYSPAVVAIADLPGPPAGN